MLYPSLSNSIDCLLSTTVYSKLQHCMVYKFLHNCSPSYFELFLFLSSCSYSTKCSYPERQYLTVSPFHSSVFKSVKHFGHSFAFDAPNIWNELPYDVCSTTSVTSFRKKLKNLPVCKSHSLPCHPLMFIALFYVQMCPRVCN